MLRYPQCAIILALGMVPALGAGAQARAYEEFPLVRPALERDELSRIGALLDSTAPRYSTLRAPSRQLPWHMTRRAVVTLLSPELTLGVNTSLPYGFNDGPAWQGRGLNVQAIGGFVITRGRVRVVVAPQYVFAQNTEFQTIPYPQSSGQDRSPWANPFHPAPGGIDLPSRFGNQPVRSLQWGQSSATVRLPVVEVGLSTENVWWGPGIQNALLWGSQGPGVPAAFVRTTAPVVTRAGTWDAWWTAGTLRESNFFDRNPRNDRRSMGAFAVSWRPPRTTGVEVGLSRLVILADDTPFTALFAPLASVGRPNGPDSLDFGSRDQITSLWTRWAPPGAGFEAWAEWARFEEPASLRDLLESPGHSQGYTVGLQWARRLRGGSARLWGEATYLEPSPSLRLRPVGTTYVSRSVPQGFSVRGQPLGAGIGPGASSQWMGGDFIRPNWRAGAYAARVRWDNATLFTSVVPELKREDISLISGLRLGGTWRGLHVLLDWAHAVRLNYLYQAYLSDPATGRTQGIDIVNDALTVTLSMPWQWGAK